jgi:hypothetical protein
MSSGVLEKLVFYIDIYLEFYNKKEELDELNKYLFENYLKDNIVAILYGIDELFELFNKKGMYSDIQIVNYIFFLFNDDLYKNCLKRLESGENMSYIFYGILWAEHFKYCFYEEILNKLVSNSPRSRVRNEITKHRCLEHMVVCLEVIDRYYSTLVNNYGHLEKEIEHCDNIIKYFKIYTPIREKYDIEIVVENFLEEREYEKIARNKLKN